VFEAATDVNVRRLRAALSYYTAFSLAPLLVIAIAVAGLAFGHEAAQGRIVAEGRGLGGKAGAGAGRSARGTTRADPARERAKARLQQLGHYPGYGHPGAGRGRGVHRDARRLERDLGGAAAARPGPVGRDPRPVP